MYITYFCFIKYVFFSLGWENIFLLFKTIVTAIEKAKLKPKSSKRRDFFKRTLLMYLKLPFKSKIYRKFSTW